MIGIEAEKGSAYVDKAKEPNMMGIKGWTWVKPRRPNTTTYTAAVHET
jgi:hypothetical protein